MTNRNIVEGMKRQDQEEYNKNRKIDEVGRTAEKTSLATCDLLQVELKDVHHGHVTRDSAKHGVPKCM